MACETLCHLPLPKASLYPLCYSQLVALSCLEQVKIIPSFTSPTFMECQLYIRHCSEHWGHSSGQDRKNPTFLELIFGEGRTINKISKF